MQSLVGCVSIFERFTLADRYIIVSYIRKYVTCTHNKQVAGDFFNHFLALDNTDCYFKKKEGGIDPWIFFTKVLLTRYETNKLLYYTKTQSKCHVEKSLFIFAARKILFFSIVIFAKD